MEKNHKSTSKRRDILSFYYTVYKKKLEAVVAYQRETADCRQT